MRRQSIRIESVDEALLPLQLRTLGPISRAGYLALVHANPDLRLERSAEGEVIIMAPAHTRSGIRNAELTAQLRNWALADGTGLAGDSSTGFDLPNGANRAPDASWVLIERVQSIPDDKKEDYLPLCPDFVVELRSKTDRLFDLRAKMQEYLANGARLGWLIDPLERCVCVYRPGKKVEVLDDPATVSGDPELPGFVLDLTRIWAPGF